MFSKPQQISRVKVHWLQDVHVSNFGFYCWGRVLWPCSIAGPTALHALITPWKSLHPLICGEIYQFWEKGPLVTASASVYALSLFACLFVLWWHTFLFLIIPSLSISFSLCFLLFYSFIVSNFTCCSSDLEMRIKGWLHRIWKKTDIIPLNSFCHSSCQCNIK